MSKAISATVPTPTKAEEVINRLQAAGFANTEISVLFAESANANITLEKHTKALKEGHVLLSVHTDDEERMKKAREIFKESGAENIAETEDLAA